MGKFLNFLLVVVPYFTAIVAFYGVTLFFFQPELLEGKRLQQGDVMQYEGMSKHPSTYLQKTGEQALWNDGMFSGTPDYLISTGVPHQPLAYLSRVANGFFDLNGSAHLLFLLFLCFWITLLCFKIEPYTALFGALAFGLNTYNILNLEAGHVTKTWALAYGTLLIGGMRLVFRGKMWLGTAVFVLGFALHLRVPHYQITYYLAFVCLIYGISELIFALRKGALRAFVPKAALLLLAVCIGAMVGLGRVAMVKEYEPYSIRGASELAAKPGETTQKKSGGLDKDYAFSWSLGKMETLTMLVPYFYGGASQELLGRQSASYKTLKKLMHPQQFAQMASPQGIKLPTYRGEMPFTGGPLYAGAVVCFLFVFALFLLDKRTKYWIIGGFLITLFIAWGRHFALFNDLMFDYFPGFNKFRAVMMALTLSATLMLIAAMLGLQKAFSQKWDSVLRKKMLYAAGITGGLTLFIAIFGGLIDFSAPADASLPAQLALALEKDRLSLARADAFRSFILIVLSFAALWLGLWLRLSRKISVRVAVLLVALLMVADLWQIDRRYLNAENFHNKPMRQITAPTAADKAIRKDKDPHYRVFNLAPNTFQEARTSYFHKSLGGYFAAKMRRYQDLYERKLAGEQQEILKALQSGQTKDLGKANIANMLNAKYFISRGQSFKNPYALGNAWFVGALKTVNSPDEEIREVATLQTAREAVVDKSKFAINASLYPTDSASTIRLKSYTPRKIVYQTENTYKGLAVFSEIYYPKGWQATIDGKPTDILRANYVLRALEIPAGKHEVVFNFAPKSYEKGAIITQTGALSSTILAIICLILHFWMRRKNKAQHHSIT